jgi:DNA-binding HxlR family transcriptional regulator
MPLPKPGTPVRGSRSGRPIMALLDLLGRRWLLRIIWELRDTPLTFRELQGRCDAMSPTVLNQRLRDLREADIVVSAESGGYTLSRSGVQLLEALMPLLRWSESWQKKLALKTSADDDDQA